MRKIYTFLTVMALALLVVFSTLDAYATGEPTPTTPAGSGTSGSPYQITNIAELYWVTQNSSSWGAYFQQTADIDASGSSTWDTNQGFTPIGTDAGNPFAGNYDGQGHTISNLYIDRGVDHQALFGCILGGSAIVINLGVVNATIYGYGSVGALAGSLEVGASLEKCFSTGYVSGTTFVGGLVGYADGITITNCYSEANVWAAEFMGGLIGSLGGGGTATNCYSTGAVSMLGPSGGLVGNNGGTITNCFYDTNTSGQGDTGNGTPKTTLEMQTQNTFTGWDFTTTPVWSFSTGGHYPFLNWQSKTVSYNYATDDWTPSTPTYMDNATISIYYYGTGFECHNLLITPNTDVFPQGALASITIGNNLTMQSDASNTANLVHHFTIGGTTTVERYLTGNEWHIVSSPVANQGINALVTAPGNSIAVNDIKYGLGTYNESSDSWTTFTTGTAPGAGSIIPGLGYEILRTGDGLVSFTGTANISDVTGIPISRAGFGWNMLGNPFLSAIQITGLNKFLDWNADNLDPSYAAVYLWDPTANAYKTINNIGTGDLPGWDCIQVCQAFSVKAKDNIGQTVSFTENMQTDYNGLGIKSGVVAWPTIKLMAENGSGKSSTVVSFNSKMTTGLDVTYDAGMYKSNKDFALYTRLIDDNGVDFAIQALPEDYASLSIPLGIDAPEGTTVKFSAELINLPANCQPILEDRAAKVFTPLSGAGSSYSATITAQTKGTGNFILHTSQNSVTASKINKIDEGFKVLVQAKESKIRISSTSDLPAQAQVYDLAGRLITNGTVFTGDNLLKMQAKQGIYLLRIQNSKQQFSQKIVWY